MDVFNKLNQGLFLFYGPSGMAQHLFFTKIINSYNFKKILHLSLGNKISFHNLSKGNLKKYFNVKLSDFNSLDSMIRSVHKMNLSNCVIVIDSINQFYRMQLQNAKKQEKEDFRVMFSFQLKILEHLSHTNLILTCGEIYSKTIYDDSIKKEVDSFELYDSKILSKYNLVKLEKKYFKNDNDIQMRNKVSFKFSDKDNILQEITKDNAITIDDNSLNYFYEVKDDELIFYEA